MIVLRDYQHDLVERAGQSFKAGNKAVIVQLPTGGGKTAIGARITSGAVAKGRRTGLIAHRRELVRQLEGKMLENGLRCGLIMPGFPETHDAVQAASVQSLAPKALRYRFDMLLVDEVHHMIPGSLYSQIIDANPGIPVIGLTATPQRLDGRGLGKVSGGYFDDLIIGPSVRALTEQGYLSPYKAFSHAPPPGKWRTTGGDFNKGDLEEAMDKPRLIGDAVEHYRTLAEGQRAICFCVSVEHAHRTAEAFRAAGYRALAVDGLMDKESRAKALAGLATGAYDIITSCELISEGLDVPGVSCVILMRPTQSLTLFLQSIGRANRPFYMPGMPLDTVEQRLAAIAAGDKPCYTILDHAGNIGRLGLPDEDREWSLAGRDKKARKVLPPINECKVCFAVFAPAEKCPECGATVERAARKELEHEDGALVEVDAAAIAAARKAKQRQVGKCRTIADLQAIAVERGYKQGWVYKQAQLRGIHS